MTKRITVLLLIIVSVFLFGCAQPSANSNLERQIEQVLRDNPQIILDILSENKIELFNIAQAGLDAKRREMERQEELENLRNPHDPEISPDRAMLGSPDAPITIVEYSDFQCPYCSRAAHTILELIDNNPDEFRLIFKHLPLPSHENAEIAARYFEAASMQDADKAWKLHDLMFDNRETLAEEGEVKLMEWAASLELDMQQLAEDIKSEEVTNRLEADYQETEDFRINSTPTFLFNGVKIVGALPLEDFEAFVEKVKNREQILKDAEESAETTADDEDCESGTAEAGACGG